MKAYVIVNVNVKDPVRYADYVKAASPTVTAHGGRYMATGRASRAARRKCFREPNRACSSFQATNTRKAGTTRRSTKLPR